MYVAGGHKDSWVVFLRSCGKDQAQVVQVDLKKIGGSLVTPREVCDEISQNKDLLAIANEKMQPPLKDVDKAVLNEFRATVRTKCQEVIEHFTLAEIPE